MVALSKIVDGKKFMWDGGEYPDKKNALEIAQKYIRDGSEVKVIEEEKKYFVFTCRAIKEVVVESQPAI